MRNSNRGVVSTIEDRRVARLRAHAHADVTAREFNEPDQRLNPEVRIAQRWSRPHAPWVCRVLIADDVEAVRFLWREILTEDDRLSVVGDAANGIEAVAGVEKHRPDVLLLDLAMPGMDGLEVIRVLRDTSPETKIVVLSGFTADRMAPRMLELGATAYIEKGAPPQHLLQVVHDACETSAHR